MTHSDDLGLVLPPKLAPIQVVIIPIPKTDAVIDETVEKLMKELRSKGISVQYDTDDKQRPGFKFAENELKGIPVRIGIGQRDLALGQVEIARRDTKTKSMVPLVGIADYIAELLDNIQSNLFQKALNFRKENTTIVDDFKTFSELIESKGGFFEAHWDGTEETENKIKNATKATIRCIPLDQQNQQGSCMVTGKPSKGRVIIAKAY
jgi:prolyl-tRNA synthetase